MDSRKAVVVAALVVAALAGVAFWGHRWIAGGVLVLLEGFYVWFLTNDMFWEE